MSTVKRVAPPIPQGFPDVVDLDMHVISFRLQCFQDLDAGRHAVGCECERWEGMLNDHETTPNACSEIVRCALKMLDYTVEVQP